MPKRPTPSSANVAHPSSGAKLVAPAAARNVETLCDLLAEFAPLRGNALELASGTGQHIVRFASRLPDLNWQPSEVDSSRQASIDAYVTDAALSNLRAPIRLNACSSHWSDEVPSQSLILLTNLLHLISTDEAEQLISQAAHALAPQGTFIIYGPFKRGGKLTSDGDRAFHRNLSQHDPDIGYKNDAAIINVAEKAGLGLKRAVELPANNLALILTKTT